MCSPDHFAIEYEINPWMDRRRAVDRAMAHRQWDALYRTLLEDVQAIIEVADPIAGLPDLVFTANAGLVVGRTFIPSNFRYPQRAREERSWQAWFQTRGYEIICLPPNLHFEGEGDLLPCDQLLVAGYRFRSDRESAYRVGELLSREVLALQLADPWFYHLDTCFCPLTEDAVLYYPEAFTPEGRKAIAARFHDAISVALDEARRFVCNSVVIGHHVVMSARCPAAQADLQTRGFNVHPVDVSEFMKAGGGAKCLSLFLARVPAAKGEGLAGVAGRRAGQTISR